jgi:glyoxylase I family protein
MRFLLLSALLFALAAPARAQIAPVNANGLTYGHVQINVTSLDVHRAFWSRFFDGRPFERGPVSGVMFPNLMLLMTEQPPTFGSQGGAMDHFGFKVRDLAAFLAKWRAAGLEVQSEFTGNEGFPNAYVVGPDGVRIELQQDATLTRDVIGHHIHFITLEHEALLSWYIDTFGLERFARGKLLTTANAPGINISYSLARAPAQPSPGRAIDHIGFEFADLEAEVRRLQAKGIEVEPIRDHPGAALKSAFITDPAGVRVELTQGLAAY